MRRLPARVRLTAGFAAAMGVLFGLGALTTYRVVASALLDELDTGLRARAAAIQGALVTAVPDPAMPAGRAAGIDLGGPSGRLVEPTEAFAQVLDSDGHVLTRSRGLDVAALAPRVVAGVDRALLFVRVLPGMPGRIRVLAVPVHRGDSRFLVVVGASMSDRDDTLAQVRMLMAVGGPGALALASFVGWLLAGRALGPVERMRNQAATITAVGLQQRLTVPPARDELSRLATTLNAMLTRLEDSRSRERRFLDQASHELRTPLSVLRTELDLALARPRSHEQLLAALRSAQEEADRLCRLADDLLILSRAEQGRLPLRRTLIPLDEPLHAAARHFTATAATRGVGVQVDAPDTPVWLDGTRVRQAVENLIDNALRYAPDGSTVTVDGRVDDACVRIGVGDCGPGLPPERAARIFEPFGTADPGPPAPGTPPAHRSPHTAGPADGTGLGLPIVQAIADAHGGTATLDVDSGPGTRITLILPRSPA